jgi:hypothetical protein
MHTRNNVTLFAVILREGQRMFEYKALGEDFEVREEK